MKAGSAADKISTSVGLIAAMVLAVLVNIFVARHYKRWDVTKGGLYTLSEPTVTTLRSLEEPIQIYVLLGAGDPLTISLHHLLESYGSETTRIDARFIDPDRHPAEFLALQQRYRIVAGKTDDGRIVTDASVIVVRGEKPFFLTPRDLVEVEDENDMRARPRLEQAITGAIRSLLLSERPVACFTTGFGEKTTDVGGGYGLAALRDRLVKNNFDVIDLPPVHPKPEGNAGQDEDEDEKPSVAPQQGSPAERIAACSVVIVAGPSEKVAGEDVARLKGYIERGGNMLFAVGPVPDEDNPRYLDLGLSDAIALAGVKLEQDFIFERDLKLRSTLGHGETFMPMLRPHAITDGLMKAEARGLGVVLNIASSLSKTGAGSAAPVELLVTSDEAFGMVDFFAWAKNPTEPAPVQGDHRGPLAVAYAAELPAKPGSNRGARMVVVGSMGVLVGANWDNDDLRGTARFVESAIAWLAARPMMLDIPPKPSFAAGLRLSADSVSEIFRYVVLFMPLSAVLLGVAVFLRRRSTERRGTRQAGKSS